MRGIRTGIALLLIPAIGTVMACRRSGGGGPSVTIARVTTEQTSPEVTVVTTLQAGDRAKIALPREIHIEKVHVAIGDTVIKGDPLVTLASDHLQSQRNQSQAEQSETAAELEQAEYLLEHREELLANQQMDRLQYNGLSGEIKALKARLTRQQADTVVLERALSETTLRSPLDGLVAEKAYTQDQVVPAGGMILEIVNTNPILATFALTADEASGISIGNRVSVRIEDLPGETFTALVRFISPELQPSDHTFTVWAAMDNPMGFLKIGMRGFAEFHTNTMHNVYRVPKSAITVHDRRPQIVVITNGVARFHAVTIKAVEDDEVVLSRGVGSDDVVVIRGHEGLHDGMIVDIR